MRNLCAVQIKSSKASLPPRVVSAQSEAVGRQVITSSIDQLNERQNQAIRKHVHTCLSLKHLARSCVTNPQTTSQQGNQTKGQAKEHNNKKNKGPQPLAPWPVSTQHATSMPASNMRLACYLQPASFESSPMSLACAKPCNQHATIRKQSARRSKQILP